MLTSSRPVQATKTSRAGDAGAGQHIRRRAAAYHDLDVELLESIGGFLRVIDDDDLVACGERLGQPVSDFAAACNDYAHVVSRKLAREVQQVAHDS